jgi:hypothetical protein
MNYRGTLSPRPLSLMQNIYFITSNQICNLVGEASLTLHRTQEQFPSPDKTLVPPKSRYNW